MQQVSKLSHSFLLAVLVLGMWLSHSTVATAATRTVCFQVNLRDARVQCPDSSSQGPKRACLSSDGLGAGYSRFAGAVVELWDKDSCVAYDDYIGSWYTSENTWRCATLSVKGPRTPEGRPVPMCTREFVLKCTTVVPRFGPWIPPVPHIRR